VVPGLREGGTVSGRARRTVTATIAAFLLAACGGSAPATADPPPLPLLNVTNPVEVLFGPGMTAGFGLEPVYSQCDNHGHRVFASRHPIDFRVLNDPTCPGGGPK
jgi:hypothetical protein